MSDTAGHVARWDAYIEDTGAPPHISWIVDAHGEMVTYVDHRKIVDTLAAQAREPAVMLWHLIEQNRDSVDGLTRTAPIWAEAQAVLDAEGGRDDRR